MMTVRELGEALDALNNLHSAFLRGEKDEEEVIEASRALGAKIKQESETLLLLLDHKENRYVLW